MTEISMTFNKSAAVKSVESLLFKYGAAIEGADNYRQVFNTQSDSTNDTLDEKAMSDTYDARSKEAFSMLKDFGVEVSLAGDVTTVSLSMPSRWNGKTAMLQGALERYIEDGMMADWLNVTAPGESSIYTNRLQQDVADINKELYTKGAPQ